MPSQELVQGFRRLEWQPLMTSRSAIEVTLELYELEALIGWHTDQKWRHADREEYSEAEICKRRMDELYAILTQRKHDMKVESAADRLMARVPKSA